MTQLCPREDCTNTLTGDQIVCTADFHRLAGMCRGKKRIGQPEAAWIEGCGRGVAYECALCRQYHNGNMVKNRMELIVAARATVRALRADPRVGWAGVLHLADAWSPRHVNRSRWHEGIDQREAVASS